MPAKFIHKPKRIVFSRGRNTSSFLNISVNYKRQVASLRQNNRELAQQLSLMQLRAKNAEDKVVELQKGINLQVPKVVSGNLFKMVSQLRTFLEILDQTLNFCADPESVALDATILNPDLDLSSTPQNAETSGQGGLPNKILTRHAKHNFVVCPMTPIEEQTSSNINDSYENGGGESLSRRKSQRSGRLSNNNNECGDQNVTRRTKSKSRSTTSIDLDAVLSPKDLDATVPKKSDSPSALTSMHCFVDLERLPLVDKTTEVTNKCPVNHTDSYKDLETEDLTVKIPVDMELTVMNGNNFSNVVGTNVKSHSPAQVNQSPSKMSASQKSPVSKIETKFGLRSRNRNDLHDNEKMNGTPPSSAVADGAQSSIDDNRKGTSASSNINRVSSPLLNDRVDAFPEQSNAKRAKNVEPIEMGPSCSGTRLKRLTYVVQDESSTSSDEESDYEPPAKQPLKEKQKSKVKRGFENYRFFSTGSKKSIAPRKKSVKLNLKVIKSNDNLEKKSPPSIYDPSFKDTPPALVNKVPARKSILKTTHSDFIENIDVISLDRDVPKGRQSLTSVPANVGAANSSTATITEQTKKRTRARTSYLVDSDEELKGRTLPKRQVVTKSYVVLSDDDDTSSSTIHCSDVSEASSDGEVSLKTRPVKTKHLELESSSSSSEGSVSLELKRRLPSHKRKSRTSPRKKEKDVKYLDESSDENETTSDSSDTITAETIVKKPGTTRRSDKLESSAQCEIIKSNVLDKVVLSKRKLFEKAVDDSDSDTTSREESDEEDERKTKTKNDRGQTHKSTSGNSREAKSMRTVKRQQSKLTLENNTRRGSQDDGVVNGKSVPTNSSQKSKVAARSTRTSILSERDSDVLERGSKDDTNDANLRSTRRKNAVSYKEPKLSTKLRRDF